MDTQAFVTSVSGHFCAQEALIHIFLHPDYVANGMVFSLYCERGCVRHLSVFLVRDPNREDRVSCLGFLPATYC